METHSREKAEGSHVRFSAVWRKTPSDEQMIEAGALAIRMYLARTSANHDYAGEVTVDDGDMGLLRPRVGRRAGHEQ